MRATAIPAKRQPRSCAPRGICRGGGRLDMAPDLSVGVDDPMDIQVALKGSKPQPSVGPRLG
ncbi:gliding motility protein MglA [Chelatococcus asaccharovorans]|nr:gliding motility protein MglA [Chelatococcus asaccharovorans]